MTSNGPHIQFAKGGFISSNGAATFSGTIQAASITITNSANQMKASLNKLNKAAGKLKFQLEEFTPPDYCHNRRGGPKSKVFCEVPVNVPHEIHSGRGRTGNWFSWKERF